MKTVELSAALNSAQVVENLKNFVGVDAQGAAALMTPERLAAVAGEKMDKGILIKETDLDTIIQEGKYLVSSGTPQFPLGGLLSVIKITDYVYQIYVDIHSVSIQIRVKYADEAWGVWNKTILS